MTTLPSVSDKPASEEATQASSKPCLPALPLKALQKTLLLLTLYVLSLGPMFPQWYRAAVINGNPSSLIVQFYAPLVYFCRFEPFREWLQWYVLWWL